jgi:ligand-binding sensor domain-containing protein
MKTKKMLLVSSIFTIITLACGFGPKTNALENAPSQASSPAPHNETTNSGSINQPVSIDLSLLGDNTQVVEGGFSFRVVPEYTLDLSGGMVIMAAPGADPDLGPIMQLMGWMNESNKTNEDLYTQLKNETPMQVGAPQEIQVSGLPGLAADIIGDNNGKTMQGRVAMVMVNPKQQFILMFGAPQAEWDKVAPLFNAVLASVEFFEIQTPSPISSMSPGSYAYTNNNVVRDVVVYQNMAYAATLGGMVAWNMDSGYSMAYTPLQGMGHVSAVSITACQIPEPRIIVGTLQGLSIYDPSTGLWDERSIVPDESKIDNSKITRLFCDQANNRLLIGYNGLGVLDLNSGVFQRFTKQEGLVWEEVTDVTVSGKDIWIATGYKGVAKISGSTVTTFSVENGMPDERAFSVAAAKDGALWVGTSSGLLSFKGGKWTMFGSDTAAKLTDINEIEFSSDGKLWVATAPLGGGRICQFNPGNGTCEVEFKDPDYLPLLALSLNRSGLPVYGTGKGLYIYDGENSLALKTDSQLTSNFVDSFLIADEENLWIGMDAGIQVLNPADPTSYDWLSFSKADTPGLGGNWASEIASSIDGVIWVAVINGEASRYANGSWTSFPEINSFNVVAVDEANRAWFGDDGKGIIVLNPDGSPAMTFTTATGLPSDKISALLTDDQGTVWIGTDSGLAKYENGQLSVVFGKDDARLPNRYIRDLALAPDGTIIIGMFTAAARYDRNQVGLLVDFLKDGYSDLRLTTLTVTPSGQIWIGTDKGLLQPDGFNGYTLLTTENGLLTNYISALQADPFGAIWVGGGGSNFDGGGILQIVP